MCGWSVGGVCVPALAGWLAGEAVVEDASEAGVEDQERWNRIGLTFEKIFGK